MRRVLLAAAALAIPISGVVVGFSSPAFAGKKVTITCKSLSGTETAAVLSECTGGNTGGSSGALNLASGGTIDWVSGSTTTVGTPSAAFPSSKKCIKMYGAGSEAVAVKAAVSGDTGDGIKVPGTISGSVCINGGNVLPYKPVKIT
jgi:hypothetical protein